MFNEPYSKLRSLISRSRVYNCLAFILALLSCKSAVSSGSAVVAVRIDTKENVLETAASSKGLSHRGKCY
jgi:hypothetical protein